jgi:ubiquinone/menaquinone biosynthesis C-methylase UbiE
MKPDKETFYEWNEQHAIKHDLEKFYNHPNRLFRYIENKRIKVLIDYAQIKDDDLVLEVGCGSGHILERIKRGKLTGIDVSPTQIERAGKKLNGKAELIRSPGEAIPFPDKHFDRVICTEVFEHVLEPADVLSEMRRVVKDEGVISLSVPNEKLIMIAKGFLLNFGFRRVLEPKQSQWDLAAKNNLDEWHIHKYSLNLIKKQAAKYFTIEKIARIPFYFLPFRYVLKLKKKIV